MTLSPQLEARFQKILSSYPKGRERSAVIPMLMYAQDEIGSITQELIEEVAHRTGIKPLQVDEVIGYYSMMHPITLVADPGPTAGTVTASDKPRPNRRSDFRLILAQVKPGLTGDTETITAFGTTSAGGVVKLTNGDLTYALSSTIPANGSVTDTFTYTVKDQLGGYGQPAR